MFSLFDTKFVKLYCGPMWRVDCTTQDRPEVSTGKLPIEVSNIILYVLQVILIIG